MRADEFRGSLSDVLSRAGRVGVALVRLIWAAARLPLLAVLIVLEPLVRTLLVLVAWLAALMAFFFEFFSALPQTPFWGLLGLAAACLVALVLYYGLLRLLAG